MKISYDANKFVKQHVILPTMNIQNPKIGNVNNSLNACRYTSVTKLTVARMAKELFPFCEAKISVT